MVTADVTKLIADLKKFHLDAIQRMENMVAKVAYEFVLALGNETPVGDDDSIAVAGKYRDYYISRQKYTGIAMEAGYHAGSWQFSSNGNLQFSTVIYSSQDAADGAFDDAQAKYKLGQSFYIGANTPGMVDLEGNSSSQTNGGGIVKPAVDKVMALYRIKASDYYQQ